MLMTATPGTLIRKPRGIPHAFWNSEQAPARLLEVISPGGFEEYFALMAELFASGPPDPDRAQAVRQQFGLEVDFGSMERLIAEHGLAPL
jgi:predicted dehydrogenase